MVPSTPEDPLARPGAFHTFGDPLLHLVQRTDANEVHFELRYPRVTQMKMSIVKTGHYKVAGEVDYLSLWTLPFLNFFRRTNSNDLALCEGECPDPPNRVRSMRRAG